MNTTRTYENHGRNSYPLRKNVDQYYNIFFVLDAIQMNNIYICQFFTHN